MRKHVLDQVLIINMVVYKNSPFASLNLNVNREDMLIWTLSCFLFEIKGVPKLFFFFAISYITKVELKSCCLSNLEFYWTLFHS